MKLKFAKSFFLLFFFSRFLYSQITDHNIYPEPPPPALPAAGGVFTDPTFGTNILRVTDANDGNDNHHAYSYWPCMNSNSTRLYVFQTGLGPTLYDFDTINFSVSNKRLAFTSNCPSGSAPDAENAIWSDLNPDIIFVHDRNLNLYAYNVSSQSYSLIKDFTSLFPAGSHTGQMNKNHTSDDLFTFTLKDVNWSVAGMFAWRQTGDQLYAFSFPNADECQPDRGGNYLIVKLGTSGQYVVESKIIELSTGTIKDLFDGGPANPNTPGPYWGPGHGDMGSGTVMGNDNWNNRFVGRTCANADSFYVVRDWQNDWSQDYHASGLSDDENWILLSTYVSSTALPNSGNFKNEIFQVSTDGKDSVRRFAHHHSDYVSDYNANGGGNAYWSSPKGSISKNGKWVVFTSNWGSILRKDVFVLKVPQTLTSAQQENMQRLSVNIFPNPFSSHSSIAFSDELKDASFIIYDVVGKQIRTIDFSGKQLSIKRENLKSGIYFYQIVSDNKSVSFGKLMVE